MLKPEQIEALRDTALTFADPISAFLLDDIARRIAEAGQLTSTASYQVWRVQNLGLSQDTIRRELQKRLKATRASVNKLLSQSAEVGYRFDLERLPTAGAVAFEENEPLQQIVQAAVQLADSTLQNMTQTLGLIGPSGITLPYREAYVSWCDHAFQLVSTGATDYTTAINMAVRKLAERGVQTISYASGKRQTVSLEAAVRRSVFGGLGLMVEQTQQLTHDQMGCDGWEISAHANAAPDHEPIQGKQYTDAEYEALNNSLVRRIGTLNCGHIAFPVIVGVSQPQYSPEELHRFQTDNASGLQYGERHYTGYEATQRQRQLERMIRARKRRVSMTDAAGGNDLTAEKGRLRALQEEYTRFSKQAGLRTQRERLLTWQEAVQ